MTRETETDTDDVNVRLDEFIEENYRLFALLGVFGALAIYLKTFSQSNDSSTIVNISIICSLIVFLVISYHITYDLVSRLYSGNFVNIFGILILRNLDILLFSIGFYGIILGVLYAALSFPQAINLLIRFFIFLFTIVLLSTILVITTNMIDKKYGQSVSPYFLIIATFVCILLVLVLSGTFPTTQFSEYHTLITQNPIQYYEVGSELDQFPIMSLVLSGSLMTSTLFFMIGCVAVAYLRFFE